MTDIVLFNCYSGTVRRCSTDRFFFHPVCTVRYHLCSVRSLNSFFYNLMWQGMFSNPHLLVWRFPPHLMWQRKWRSPTNTTRSVFLQRPLIRDGRSPLPTGKRGTTLAAARVLVFIWVGDEYGPRV
uniref:Uncharacterized protein n=1 Tax=Cacopsylla melanoneura TaxID=428564 RepID=A0A8D8M6T5_9HEMI